MGITEKALVANGRSRACARCPIGVPSCGDTMKKFCRDIFVEAYTKGYEQGKKGSRMSRADVIREYCRKGGIL